MESSKHAMRYAIAEALRVANISENWKHGIWINGPATPSRKYPTTGKYWSFLSQRAMKQHPAIIIIEPVIDVVRGPNRSSISPSGSLQRAFPAMPIVATEFINLCFVSGSVSQLSNKPDLSSTVRSAVQPYTSPDASKTCEHAVGMQPEQRSAPLSQHRSMLLRSGDAFVTAFGWHVAKRPSSADLIGAH